MMKKTNQRVIIDIIYHHYPISRVKIAEITGLSPATVSNIVKELLGMGLINESKRGESRGGRKPVLLEINPAGAYLIGLEWGITQLRGILLDLDGEMKLEKRIEVEDFSPESFVKLTEEIVKEFSNRVDDSDKIAGIGVGVHGLVDPGRGISLFAPHFKWENIAVKGMLEERLSYPVFIDNDVRMMALAEKWRGQNDFVFVNTGPGIGAAIVMGNNLYYGSDWSAGEFGHLTIVEDGPVCSCGNTGCLESLTSVERLVERYNAQVEDLSFGRLRKEWSELILAVREGHQRAEDIVTGAALYLGTGIANLINLLNPESIIIGGDYLLAEDIIFPIIKEQVKKKALGVPGSNIGIFPSYYGERAGAIGSATLVLQELFKLEEGVM